MRAMLALQSVVSEVREAVQRWVLMHYKLPPEPSAPRVLIWRKLKRLGALLLQDAVWVLPATPSTRENFQWLTVEIVDRRGEAMVWDGQLVRPDQDEALVHQFQARVDAAYHAIMDDLAHE